MPDMTLRNSLIILFGLLASSVHSHETNAKGKLRPRENSFKLAVRLASPVIEPRAPFYGGWALAMKPCPSGLDDHNGSCCPKGTFLHSVSLGGIPKGYACCPDEVATCGDAVSAIPICADTTWDLWVNSGQWPFCCLEGSIGYRTPGGIWGAGSLCAVAGVPVPTSVLASSMELSTAAATPTPTGQKTSTAAHASSTSGGQTNTNNNDNSVAINDGSSPSSSPTSSSTSSSTSASDTSGSGSSTSTSNSLSTSAIASIAAAAVIVVVAVALVLFLVRRRKNSQNTNVAVVSETKPPDFPTNVGNETAYHEMHGKTSQIHYPQATEADGSDGRRTELAG